MARFDYFVVFAEMRTGSNFLEENINDYPGLSCLGELFNPHFIGHANKFDWGGIDMAAREEDPMRLLAAIRGQTEGMPGFRFFNDHDPRILRHVLPDERCAKVVLTRNPVDSYVSHKIAQATGQWRLGDMKKAKSAQAVFDAEDFQQHIERLQAFQMVLLRGLQVTGQTAFWIAYEDLQDVEVLDGLATFLGVDHRKTRVSKRTKVQNPKPLDEKVANFEEMEQALARLDRFNLNRTPNFEPRRGRAVPSLVAAARAPVLYQPIPGGPDAQVLPWLAALDGGTPEDLRTGFYQKTLRQWKRQHKGHRAFTVLRHPVLRLHAAFARHILPSEGEAVFGEMRETLRKQYGLPVPAEGPGRDWSAAEQRAAFLAFAKFVEGNLGGQTSLRVDAAWASQFEILRGMAEVQLPDMILREETLADGLGQLAEQLGIAAPAPPPFIDAGPVPLADYYDGEVEAAVRAAYQKDYMMFGFRPWGAG
ncbi:nodulation protein NodH [Psychromarinibacter sp. C21-152]|uniref:Nodulation protein NodH n=1 Tax=Psychromarinibacter sediminicola TaxID=3033385 RepID=A0AAE3NY25_9RHOB|nr:nodulation protein NodH [Psychromarinibacter sediminicola]MDF0603764.1 nodulation protein NodH [Psychromarinibacter sediminicola]